MNKIIDKQSENTSESWKDHLLDAQQMASFVADGYLIFDEIVPRDMCEKLIEDFPNMRGYLDVGSPFKNIWTDKIAGDIFRLPEVEGMIHSLIGPDPLYDHHAVHVVNANTEKGPNLHQDSVTDLRENYFDIQISLFPQDTPPEIGGTYFIPGTHFRNVRTGEISYYQHIKGKQYANCKAGTMIVWNTRLWHGARNNRTDKTRYMFKLRLNPSVPQVKLFDTSNLDDPKIPAILGKAFPCFGGDTRYEIMERVKLWRFLSDQPDYDFGERFRRRIEYTT